MGFGMGGFAMRGGAEVSVVPAPHELIAHDMNGEGGGACADDGQDYSSLEACTVADTHTETVPAAGLRVARMADGASEIRYTLEAATEVRLDLFDLAGRRVATLDSGFRAAGDHRHVWNPAARPNGLYFARLRTGATVQTRTVLLAR